MGPSRRTWVYTAYTAHYKYSTIVYATNIRMARQAGRYEALKVMGRHAKISRDVIQEKK